MRRVLNSILREEYKHTQPGTKPSEIFLKLKFCISRSYANKILVYLFKSGFISVSGGFKMEVEKIRLYTNANDDESGFIENETGLNRDDTEETEISLIRQDV